MTGLKIMKAILVLLFLTISSSAYARVNFLVINKTDRNISFEVRGEGVITLPPGYEKGFDYTNPNAYYEAIYSCKQFRGEVLCGTDERIEVIVNASNCSIQKGRLGNNTIMCE